MSIKLALCQANLGGIAFNPEDRIVAVGNEDKLDLYDCESGKLLRTTSSVGTCTSLTFSPDGRRIASVGYESTVALTDVSTGKMVLQLPGLSPGRPADQAADVRVQFASDGLTLISTNWDGSINIWSARTERESGGRQ